MAEPLARQAPPEPARPAPRRAEWVEPALVAVVFGLFVLYSLWESFFHMQGTYHHYVSPFFSPQVGKWFGFRVFTALPVVWVPFLFRATCYYYRREYNRAWFWHPSGCAARDPGNRPYRGERRFPFSWTNLHRYFWYLAVIVLIFLWKDTVVAFFYRSGFEVRVGSLLMLINTLLLTFYTFSCHAFRHLAGGGKDCYSCPMGPNQGKPTTSYTLWTRISRWNQRHGTWAWASLFSVWAVDLYIRLLIMGAFPDVRLF